MRVTYKNNGFTLIEIAIVIGIFGLLTVAAIQFAMPFFTRAREIETFEKIKRIERAVSAYALKNMRIPCPAVPNQTAANPPYGFERGSGAAGDQIGACAGAANAIGMVPFKTLGLSEDDVIDAWKNPFTYAVTPAFTGDPDAAGTTVHPRCRLVEWYTQEPGGGLLHKNPRKARFCCPAEPAVPAPPAPPLTADLRLSSVLRASDVTILLESVTSALGTGSRSAVNSEFNICGDTTVWPTGCIVGGAPNLPQYVAYTNTDQPYPTNGNFNFIPPPPDQPTGIALALVSHGPNGLYAYNLLNGNRQPAVPVGTFPAAPGGSLEAENADDDDMAFNAFINRSTQGTGAFTFDDLVSWKTQDELMLMQGVSCAVP